MYLLRRTAFKALSSSSAAVAVKPRTYTTFTQLSRTKPQWALSSFQKRFASDEAASPAEATATDETVPSDAPESADTQDRSTTSSAMGSVTESTARAAEGAKEAAEDALETAAKNAEAVKEAVSGGAAAAAAAVKNPFADIARHDDPARGGARVPGATSSGIEPSTTLYVGNLFFETTEQALRREFSQYGEISNIKIIYDHRGLSKGFGYVEFVNQEDANQAIANIDQKVFDGRRITVQYHRKRTAATLSRPQSAAPEPTKTLFIGNMSFEMSDKDLNDLFREIRNVLDVRVAIDRRSGQPRGFAHADFIDVPSATRAKEVLAGKEIYGRKLRVDYSISNPTTPASARNRER